ncbi:uncharacterized protein LOC110991088 isoform X2 [Acanthaster planci]|uniref:Uncharacterized protein LOC110991088 isoform X2 n=1 Tax=Acanthaster planci TaxID=133434 RepID=A0A8B8A2I6_ACAPL|nr:uncharacterized protein LOC110991088 isoform X2 [Acanthaster planci]XP_022111931.1 uncharacterized protein LOC110991088 isoform X2 [Acanthaster planci]XP_022111932.1 uncharacterized protein LOC110991088 isoform X2 [Acanthaster planci]XP_022111933.1 uncharacterized protein LOC110991088 isoform X2 [Acanthaster planci]
MTRRLFFPLLALSLWSLATAGEVDKTCNIIKETAAINEFVWDLPILDSNPIVLWFSVYAQSNVYIALTADYAPKTDVPMYVIVIGGYRNTLSYISKCRDCEPLAVAEGESLQCNRLNEYWVRYEDRYLKVGHSGRRQPFLKYAVPEDDFAPRYVGYSTSYLGQGMFTFAFDKTGFHRYSEVVYWTGDPFCLDWILNELPNGLSEFCFQAKAEQGPIYLVLSPQRFRNPGQAAYEIVIGESENSKTVVHTVVRGDVAIASAETPAILNRLAFAEYCITFEPLIITFGTASRNNIFSWERDPNIPIKHVGFAGGLIPAAFRFQLEFISKYQQDIINLPPEPPVGEDKCRQMPSPCGENGVCYEDHSLSSGFRCECMNNFQGERCDVPPAGGSDLEATTRPPTPRPKVTTRPPAPRPRDPCSPTNPCQNEGKCRRDGASSYSCECKDGYTGTNCETEIPDPCSSEPCLNGGTCERGLGGSYRCGCPPGYSGFNCDIEPEDPCKSDPCGNNGMCKKTGTFSYMCTCTNGYSGFNCEIEPVKPPSGSELEATTRPPAPRPRDPCSPTNPCQNEGKCRRDGASSYSCECKDGYTGTNCETEIPDPCSSEPCLNGGTCERGLGGSYRCGCPPGYSGFNCDIEPEDPCESDPCGNNGMCERNGEFSYMCTCTNGYSGFNCEIEPVKPPSGSELEAKPDHLGECPVFPKDVAGICISNCAADNDCKKTEKCCSNSCGKVCQKACTPVRCRMDCQHGFKRNGNGCEICECKASTEEIPPKETPEDTKVCPEPQCSQECPGGFEKDAYGCKMCDCIEITEGGEDEEEEEEEPEGQVLETTGGSKEIVISNEVNTQQEQLFVIDPNDMLKFTLSSGDGDLTIAVLGTVVELLDSHDNVMRIVKLPTWCLHHKEINFAVNFITTGFKVLIITSSGEERLLTKYEKRSKKKFTCKSLRLTSKKKKRCRVRYKHKRRRRGRRGRKGKLRKFLKKRLRKKRKVCPKVRCSQDCPGGFELDTNGCQMCDCVEITEGGEDEEEEEEEPEGQVLETTGGSKEIVISNEVNTQQEQLFVIDPNDMLKFTLSSGDGDLTIAVLKTAVNILDSKEKVVKSVELPAWCVQYQQLNFAINFITTGFKVLIITSSGEERLLTKYEKKSKKKFTCKSLRLTSKKKKRCRVKYSHRRRRRGSSRRKKFKKKSYVKKTKGSSSSRKKKYKKKSYVKKTKGSSSSRKKKYKKKSYVKKTKGSSSSRKKKYKKKSYVKKARGSSEFDSFINSNFRYVGSFKRELRVLIFL